MGGYPGLPTGPNHKGPAKSEAGGSEPVTMDCENRSNVTTEAGGRLGGAELLALGLKKGPGTRERWSPESLKGARKCILPWSLQKDHNSADPL